MLDLKLIYKRAVTGFLIIIMVFGLYQMVVSGPKAKQAYNILVIEMNQISVQSQSKLINTWTFNKPGYAGVAYYYTTPKSWDDMYTYYDAELKRNGWNKTKEDVNNDDKSVEYRKGQYGSSIVYVVHNPKFNYTYELLLSYGF